MSLTLLLAEYGMLFTRTEISIHVRAEYLVGTDWAWSCYKPETSGWRGRWLAGSNAMLPTGSDELLNKRVNK